jgi:hypothetical protein
MNELISYLNALLEHIKAVNDAKNSALIVSRAPSSRNKRALSIDFVLMDSDNARDSRLMFS